MVNNKSRIRISNIVIFIIFSMFLVTGAYFYKYFIGKIFLISTIVLGFLMAYIKSQFVIREKRMYKKYKEKIKGLQNLVLEKELLINEEKKYRLALEATMDIMYCINVEKEEIYLSKAIEDFKEINREENVLMLNELIKKIIPKDKEIFKETLEKVISQKENFFNIEFRICNDLSETIWFSFRGRGIYENNNTLIYGAIRDITDNKQKEVKINFMNYYDETTGVPNRRYFIENVSEIIRISKEINEEVAIIFIDLDNFKYINDTYGHQVGDKLLSEFCKNLYGQLNHKSVLSRFGGDEFVLALRDIKNKGEIHIFLKNIIKLFNEPLKIDNKDLFCSVSIGVSILSQDGDDINILLKKADMAMYKAKMQGKNQYRFFDEEILRTINRQFDVTEGLRKAIYKNEIYLLMQPKVNIKEEKVIGYECLARWENEKLGNVPPNEFIEVAENTGLIIDLGKYIIKEAFKKCRELTYKLSGDFKLAINLSEVQLREDDIVEFIKEQLEHYKIKSSNIEFEITESVIMKSTTKNIDTLIRLKNLGFTIALDDFGTGYSSLNYLKILPIDVLKIDKSFIDDVCNDRKSEFIIEKIIELSHNFNLKVVAEGVETIDQLEYLKKNGCDIVQGYYYSKPIRYEEIKNNNMIRVSN
ncbi:MAG: EAL domain-containing protein [Clostridium sp.]